MSAVALAPGRQQPYGPEVLVEAVRRAPGVAKEQHRAYAAGEEALGNRKHEPRAEPATLDLTEQVRLVELARIAGYVAVVWAPGGALELLMPRARRRGSWDEANGLLRQRIALQHGTDAIHALPAVPVPVHGT